MTAAKRGTGSSAGNKKTGTRKSSSKKQQNIQNTRAEIRDEVALILFFVFCVLLLLSCFDLCGSVGSVISKMLFGFFGYVAYIVPVLLFVGVCFYVANRESGAAIVKCISAIVSVPVLCGLFSKNGGMLGKGIFGVLSGALGAVGSYVLLASFLVVALVIISERSFVRYVKKGSRKVYDSAREETMRCKERVMEKKAQKRSEHKVSGVSMDVTIPKKELHRNENMTEIISDPILAAEIPEPSKAKELDEEWTFADVPETEELKEKKKKNSRKKSEEQMVRTESGKKMSSSENYVFPPLRILKAPKGTGNKNSALQLRETASRLQQILKDFGVNVTVTDVSCGPTVTRYELQPDHGVKVSRVLALSDDIKLNLAVADIRIEAPIPGKAAIGIEVPNKEQSIVTLRELLASEEFVNHPSKLAFAVGKDIGGKTIITDIAKMPHLLIAGATGSGKSVCINTLIMSLLYKASPEEVRLMMIDPKVVELSAYNGIPHLLIPVVTDPKKAAGALNWAVAEMTRRYQLFADYQVRNLQGYNEKVKSVEMIEAEEKPRKLPQIVIIVDELADLMMVAPGEVEDAICRLAQLARAAGIHLIIATQRPSVNVITGLIKANMPSRLAFAVSSGVDSRTILDMNGAEKLLGKGDMLFYPYGYPKPVRIQGAFVSDDEVSAVVEFLKEHNGGVSVDPEIEEQIKNQQSTNGVFASGQEEGANKKDPLFAEAGKFIIEKDKASIGMLQRWFKIGFNRAARIMDQLADVGVVGEEQGTKPREILMSMEQFEAYIEESL